MYWMSARCSRASAPVSTANRAPAILAATSKSSIPACSPSATWSSGVKENVRGSPQRRSSTFAVSSRPSGTESCSRFGSINTKPSNSSCTRPSSASRPSSFVASASPCASSGAMSWPLAFAWPTVFAWAFRAARTSSAATCTLFRRSSSVRSRATSSAKPRRARLRATPSGSVFSRRLSSILPPEFGELLLSQAGEGLGDFYLESARHGLIVASRRQLVGKIGFTGGDGVRLVMRVAISLAVTESLHQAGGRVPQPQRYLERAVFPGVGHGGIEGRVHGIALRGAGHEHHGLRDDELALGTAEPLVHFARLERERKGARIGVADILRSHPQHTPGDVARIAAAVEHPAEPVERGVRIGPPHCLVERRDLVVEELTLLVETAIPTGRDLGGERLGHRALVRPRKIERDLEQVQAAPRIAVGRARDQLESGRIGLDGSVRLAVARPRALEHRADVLR